MGFAVKRDFRKCAFLVALDIPARAIVSMNSPFLTRPAERQHRWTTMTTRSLFIYAVTFLFSMMLLLVFVESAVTRQMQYDVDIVMEWQLMYFDSTPDNVLADAIQRHVENERLHVKYYGLFTADGRHVAGDVTALPSQLSADKRGLTLPQMLPVSGHQPPPVVRAMAERRKNGDILLVSRDVTNIAHIRRAIINAFVVGGLFCLVAGITLGLAMNVRQMGRLSAIRRVTLRIAQGDLNQRLPTGGHDEIDMLSHLVNHMLDEVERLISEVKGACDGIAHDLRTPLAHVVALLGSMAQRADILGDRSMSELVSHAQSETHRLLERFRAILRIAEIGALKRREGFGEVQLGTLVQEVGELYEPLAESHSIQFVLDVEPVPDIQGDRSLLFEALSNLVDNAIKFTPEGGTVRMALRQMPAGPQVSVADTGPGIPAAEREAVLQRLYRGERTRHVAGSGIGLSIVSAVLRVHDFTLSMASAEPGVRVMIDCWSRRLG
jgi:signal transduction histidine kinase